MILWRKRNVTEAETKRAMESNKIRFEIQNPNVSGKIANLSEDIIAEILLRLPVKSLLKFRCVSKSWCSLISSKPFIKSHLQNSKKNPNFTHHSIISTFSNPLYNLKHCSINSLLYEPITESINFEYPMNDPKNSVCVVGCCNGLCCIVVNRKHFFLWNPSTKKSKKLPAIDALVTLGHVTKYGFGFDELNDDYKVLGVLSVFWIEGRYEAIVKIYSLKTNSWKRVKDFKINSMFDGAGKFANGKLHWVKNVDTKYKLDIVSFDLGSEVLGVVEQPSCVEDGLYSAMGVIGEFLCMLYDYPKTRTDVWIMKEYGVKESWEKVMSIPYLGDPWRRGPYSIPKPLCMTLDGEVLFVCGSNVIIYDAKTNLFRHTVIRNFGEFHEIDVYIQSLVSPYLDGEPEY